MNSDDRSWFTALEPPPGGAERFAARLEALTATPHAARPGAANLGLAACLALVLMAAALWVRTPRVDRVGPATGSERAVDVFAAPELDRLLGRPPRLIELAVTVANEPATVRELETTNEKVRVYEIVR